MDLQTIRREIDEGKLAPVYFFFGEEVFPIHQLIKTIVEKHTDPGTRDFNVDILRGEEAEGANIIAMASSFPMMAERRVVIVKDVQKLSGSDKKRILAYVKSPLESTCLVLVAGKVDRRQSFYGSLTKQSRWVECKTLYENQAVEWAKRRLGDTGVTLSHEGACLLIQQVGTSLWNLHNEIEKLLTFCWGEKILDLKHVAAVVGCSRQFNTWEFTDAIGQRDLKRGLILLKQLLEAGQSPVGLIVSLSRRIMELMRIRAMLDKGMVPGAIGKALNLRPYFMRLYIEQAKRYSIKELDAAIRTLLQTDLFIKTGYLEQNMAMTLLVYRLVRGGFRVSLL